MQLANFAESLCIRRNARKSRLNASITLCVSAVGALSGANGKGAERLILLPAVRFAIIIIVIIITTISYTDGAGLLLGIC